MNNKTTEPAALAGIEPVAVYEADTDHKQFLQDSEMAKGWRWYRKDFARGAQLYSAATVEQLVQERNHYKKMDELHIQSLGLKSEQLAASQAREQQLRAALEICKKEMQGDKWDALYIDGVLANHSPEDEIERARRMV